MLNLHDGGRHEILMPSRCVKASLWDHSQLSWLYSTEAIGDGHAFALHGSFACNLHFVHASVLFSSVILYRWWAAMMTIMERVDLMRMYQMMVTMAYSMALNHWVMPAFCKQMLPVVVVDDWCLPVRLLHCGFDTIFCTAHDVTPESSAKFSSWFCSLDRLDLRYTAQECTDSQSPDSDVEWSIV